MLVTKHKMERILIRYFFKDLDPKLCIRFHINISLILNKCLLFFVSAWGAALVQSHAIV